MQSHQVHPALLEKWLKGWSLSRGLPLPEKYGSGFKVRVDWPEQKERYVFPQLTVEFSRLMKDVSEPWIFGKVCAAPAEVEKILHNGWEIQDPGYLMTCLRRMTGESVTLPEGYTVSREAAGPVTIVRILAGDADLAAIGRVVMVDDVAVYDRIATEAPHRRKGLATLILQLLEETAFSQGITFGVLVATDQGKALYEALGWELVAPYTSVVIPVK